MFRDKKRVIDYFVKPPDPKELVRKWQADLRAEQRQLERTIRDISRTETNAKKMVKESAKRGDLTSAKASTSGHSVHSQCIRCTLRCSALQLDVLPERLS